MGSLPVGEVALVLHEVRADAGGVAETPDVTWDSFLALPNVQGDVCGRILGNLKTMQNERIYNAVDRTHDSSYILSSCPS